MPEVVTYPGSRIDCDTDLTAWIQDGEVRTSSPLFTSRRAPPNPVWLRCARSGDEVAVILVDGSRDRAMLRASGSPDWVDLGPAFGVRPVEIQQEDEHLRFWIVQGPTAYITGIYRHGVLAVSAGTMRHTSQGILDVQHGEIWWTDDHEWTHDLRYAMTVEGLTVGQRVFPLGAPDVLEAHWNGTTTPVYRGLVREPRLAKNRNGTYRLVGMLNGGQLLEINGDAPLLLAEAPPNPPPPDPVWDPIEGPVDVWSILLGHGDQWPRDTTPGAPGHRMDRQRDGESVWWIKFGAANKWERWGLQRSYIWHIEDHVDDHRGEAYQFSDGRWLNAHMRVGDVIDASGNQIRWWRNGAWTPWKRFPYRTELLSAEQDRHTGRRRIVFSYDPGGPNDSIEIYHCEDPYGWSRWEERDQRTKQTRSLSMWPRVRLDLTPLTPTPGRVLTWPYQEPIPMPDTPSSIALDQVSWLHADISRWRITSRLTDIRFEAGRIVLQHSKAGQWPVKRVGDTDLEGNPWIFAWRNGRWHGATYEWLRPGQTSKGITADTIGSHIKKPPLETWTPRAGELVGFCVSTLARDNTRTINERSDVVLVRWSSSDVVWREAAGPAPTPPAPRPPDRPPESGYRDEDYAAFGAWLDEKYRTDLGREPRLIHVDPVGIGRWYHDFIAGRLLSGLTPAQAVDAINRRINDIVGLDPGVGPDNPFGPPASGPDAPRPDPSPDRGTVEPIKTDFLSAMDGMFPHLTPGLDTAGRTRVYAALRARHYTHICLYAANEGDYVRQGVRVAFDMYQDPDRLILVMDECWEAGLAPVVWLMADDSPALHHRYRPTGDLGPVVHAIQLWASRVSHFVAFLEGNEYWDDEAQLTWCRELSRVSKKPFGVHFTPGRAPMGWMRRTPPEVTSLWYQYTEVEAASEASVIRRSRDLVADLRRIRPSLTLVAAEFGGGLIGTEKEWKSRALGRAAMTVDGVIGSAHGA